jgi:hypothetical protein
VSFEETGVVKLIDAVLLPVPAMIIKESTEEFVDTWMGKASLFESFCGEVIFQNKV